MVFEIERASDYSRFYHDPNPMLPTKNSFVTEEQHYPDEGWHGYKYGIEINTLEDLLALCEETGKSIIFNPRHITIYDDYVE